MRFLKLPVAALLVSAQASSLAFAGETGQADPYQQLQAQVAREKSVNELSLYAIGTSAVLFIAANSAKSNASQLQNLAVELRRVRDLNERVQQLKSIQKDKSKLTVKEVGILINLEIDLRRDRNRTAARALRSADFLTPNSLQSKRFDSTLQDVSDRQARATKLRNVYFNSGLAFGLAFIAGQVVVRFSNDLAATFMRFRSAALTNSELNEADADRVSEALSEMADLFETI